MTNEKTKKAATSAATNWMERLTGSQRLVWVPPKTTSGCEDWDKEAVLQEACPGALIQQRSVRLATMEEEKEAASPVIQNFLLNNTRWRVKE